MKKLLRALLAWLDRKFPDQVVVTLEEYKALRGDLNKVTKMLGEWDAWAKKTDGRIEKAETAINNLNVSSGLDSLAGKLKVAPFIR